MKHPVDIHPVAVRVEALSKRYESGGKENWALRDVSFEVQRGEVLGIIGRNGAGKSTLLKLLCRIVQPTSGRAEYFGRLTSIIEIGTGFHHDLSGRENVFMSAALLGLPKERIKELYPHIVEFSGLEQEMDLPVKHYSSGMYLRLAFSVALHCDIDILLLDEVLAVGDANFRRKCYAKIRALRDQQKAIILVSHHMESILEFCDRCLLLENGNVLAAGPAEAVVDHYLELSAKEESDHTSYTPLRDEPLIRSEALAELHNESVSLRSLTFTMQPESADQRIYTDTEIHLRFTCEKRTSDDSFELTCYLKNLNEIRVLMDSFSMRRNYKPQAMPAGTYQVECTIPANLLSRGIYSLGLILGQNDVFSREVEEVARFKVYPQQEVNWNHAAASVIRPHLDWKITPLD